MATQGPLSPGTMANDTTVGTVAWANANSAKVEDGSYADLSPTFLNGQDVSNYLKATNFGFSIPDGSVISGILVEVKKSDNVSAIEDYEVHIVKGGVIGSENKNTDTNWPNTLTYYSYGSSSDKWGESWTASDINDSTFGFVISAKNPAAPLSGFQYPRVDHIRVTVSYIMSPLPTHFNS